MQYSRIELMKPHLKKLSTSTLVLELVRRSRLSHSQQLSLLKFVHCRIKDLATLK